VSSRPDISQRRRGVKPSPSSAAPPGQEAGRVGHHERLRVRVVQPGRAQAGPELPEGESISRATAPGTQVPLAGHVPRQQHLPAVARLDQPQDEPDGTVASGDYSNRRPPLESLNAIGDARIDCFEHFWQPSGRGAAPLCYPPRHLRARCNSALGINRLGPAPTVQRFTLAPTDRLLLYTDGLMEARAPDGRQFELDGQVEAVLTASSLGAALEGLVARLLDHAGGRLDDDLALVLAQPRVPMRRTA
jgi:hypothetical protein